MEKQMTNVLNWRDMFTSRLSAKCRPLQVRVTVDTCTNASELDRIPVVDYYVGASDRLKKEIDPSLDISRCRFFVIPTGNEPNARLCMSYGESKRMKTIGLVTLASVKQAIDNAKIYLVA